MHRSHPHQEFGRVALSTLTADATLQRIFRGIEDDGAAEVVPNFSPRRPSPAAHERATVLGAV